MPTLFHHLARVSAQNSNQVRAPSGRRPHSAITMFQHRPSVAAAYLQDGQSMITPTASSRPTYWLYHEVWRLLTQRDRLSRLRTILRGTATMFQAAGSSEF